MRRVLLALPLPFLAAASAPAEERVFLISGFDRLRIDGPYRVEVVPGTTARAVATGEERSLRQLSVRNLGGVLVVGAGPEGWETRAGQDLATPGIRIATPALRAANVNGGGQLRIAGLKTQRAELGLNGSGTIDVEGVDARELNATVVGGGTVTLSGKAASVRLRSSGAGSIRAEGLTADQAVIVAESAGETRLGVRHSVQINAIGLGAVVIGGTPECRIRGGGPVVCQGKVTR